MNWFEEWFDSPLYEKLYANRDKKEARQLIALLEETLPNTEGHQLLDLACGRGRHSITLAEKGYNVTGIDLSKESIKKAKQTAAAKDLDNVTFEVRDMRQPLPQAFDAVVNLFTSFGYFKSDTENANIFDSVVKMLKPEGLFVLDYLNAAKVQENYEPSGHGSFNDIEYDIKRYIEDGAIHKDITFHNDGKQKTYSERVKLYTLPWFKKQMKQRDIIIDRVYGNYEGEAYQKESSPRMLIVSHLKQ